MSSRFISGGAIDCTSGEAVVTEGSEPTGHDLPANTRHQAEWEAVERELQEERRKRADAKQTAGTADREKSLYEVLEANKAAKQAAFEEAHKLKNQFRPLDEDEVEFLEGVLVSSRDEEERVRKETQNGLDKFREEQQRHGAPRGRDLKVASGVVFDVAGLAYEDAVGGEEWHVSSATGNRKRKRKEGKATTFIGVKRKSNSSIDKKQEQETEGGTEARDLDNSPDQLGKALGQHGQRGAEQPTSDVAAVPKAKLALVDYGSDGDDSESD